MKGKVLATCISEKRGTKKTPVPSVTAIEEHGLLGDAHAGDTRPGLGHRQVSLLADESVDKMREKGAVLHAGDFAENILTRGIELRTLPVGTILHVGEAVLRITQIGKQCHNDCEIKRLVGACVMPAEGVFARVIKGGVIREGDPVTTLTDKEHHHETD